MGINLGIPPIPKFDSSMLPWLRQAVERIQSGFNRVNKITVGDTEPDSATSSAGDFWLDTTVSPRRLWVYNGTAWIVPYPLGRLALTTRTAATSATFAALQYFDTVNPVCLPNRKLRVSLYTQVQTVVATSTISVGIANSGGTILAQSFSYMPAANVSQHHQAILNVSSGAGGTIQYKIFGYTGAGSGFLVAGSSYPTYLAVDDMGPE